MKIVSKYKDYYDNIAHLYGADPMVVFDRTRSLGAEDGKPFEVMVGSDDEKECLLAPSRYGPPWYRDELQDYLSRSNTELVVLVVCGRQFLLERPVKDTGGAGKDTPLSSHSHSHIPNHEVQDILEEMANREHLSSRTGSRNKKKKKKDRISFADLYEGRSRVAMKMLSRMVESPVFVIESEKIPNGAKTDIVHFRVGAGIPQLQAIHGFPGLYPSQQLYQDLSYWIANIIRESPDVSPPPRPPLTDKEKISAHGFDEKRSFRHRV